MRVLLILLFCSPAVAQDAPRYVSAEGHTYEYSLNDHGGVLTSVWPVARFLGFGAGTTVERGTETIYLGRDCDAFSEHLGYGTWGWANGGFGVEFDDGAEVGFPRQELLPLPTREDFGCRF